MEEPVVEPTVEPVIEPSPDDWRSSLSDEVSADPIWNKYETRADADKAFVEAQKFMGREKFPMPGENATKEDWDVVFDALGRPKDVEGYKLPEGVTDDQKPLFEEFRGVARESGMLPAQYSKALEWYMGVEKKAMENQEAMMGDMRGQSEKELRTEWGSAYNEKVAQANSLIAKFGNDEIAQEVEGKLGNNPAFIKFLANIASNLGEDVIEGKGRSVMMTPEEAKKEITKIKADGSHPFNDQFHPENATSKQDMDRLYKLAYPELA